MSAPDSPPSLSRAAMWHALGMGAVLGSLLLALVLGGCGEDAAPFEEVEIFRPLATPEEIDTWQAEWDRRAAAHHEDFPDPPGDGPVEVAEYWLSRGSYRLTIKRRGSRFTLRTAGVDMQTLGGGWTSFGEGRIEGPPEGFDGAVATFAWSCLGIRYRHASDGVGRIRISEDGRSLTAVYMAHEAPALWSKAYAERIEGPRPGYATIRGQIDYRGAMTHLDRDARYELRVRVQSDAGAPIPGALVQIKGRIATRVRTDRLGSAVLAFEGEQAPTAQVISAGRTGFYNGEHVLFADDATVGWKANGLAEGEVIVSLARHDATDHPEYAWQQSVPGADPDDAMACGTCHGWHYHQWIGSRHARSADNGLVLHEYARMGREQPGLDRNCAACHQPAWAATPTGRQQPNRLRARGVGAANHCDFCHKIHHVADLHADGVDGALVLARPDPDDGTRPGAIHHVFGTAPDVGYAYMGAVRNGLFAASHLCAGCHQGGGVHGEGGAPKLDTFEEWRRWAASEIREGRRARSCQDCHMPGGVTEDDTGTLIDQMAWDAIHRTPEEIHDHRFRGVEPSFARPALGVVFEKVRETGGRMRIDVAVTNRGAGHRIPTGTWTKHVLVGVWVEGGDALAAPEMKGAQHLAPLLGIGENPRAAMGAWAAAHGTVLGVLPKTAGMSPPVADFWDPAHQADGHVDRRLAPGETRRFSLAYAWPEDKALPRVELRIVHRRGPLGAGLASTPWRTRPYDAPAEVLWWRELK